MVIPRKVNRRVVVGVKRKKKKYPIKISINMIYLTTYFIPRQIILQKQVEKPLKVTKVTIVTVVVIFT